MHLELKVLSGYLYKLRYISYKLPTKVAKETILKDVIAFYYFKKNSRIFDFTSLKTN